MYRILGVDAPVGVHPGACDAGAERHFIGVGVVSSFVSGSSQVGALGGADGCEACFRAGGWEVRGATMFINN